jgi:hypothetical protein
MSLHKTPIERAPHWRPLDLSPNETDEDGRMFCVTLVMKPADFAFSIGLMVTVVTTIAAPGGLFESFVIGTGSGVLAVGVTTLILEMVLKR